MAQLFICFDGAFIQPHYIDSFQPKMGDEKLKRCGCAIIPPLKNNPLHMMGPHILWHTFKSKHQNGNRCWAVTVPLRWCAFEDYSFLFCHFSLCLTGSSSLPKITRRAWKKIERADCGGGGRHGKCLSFQESLVRPLDPQRTFVDCVAQWLLFKVQRSRVQCCTARLGMQADLLRGNLDCMCWDFFMINTKVGRFQKRTLRNRESKGKAISWKIPSLE